MCGEHSGDVRAMLLQIKHARARHPFVELRYYIIGLLQVMIDKTLNHLTCGIAKQHRLDVIPLATDTVEFILLPEMAKYLIFRLIQRRIVHQNGNRAAFNFPASDADFQTLRQSSFAPFREQGVVFNKIKRFVRFLNDVGSDRNIMVVKQLAHHIRFRGEHRVDAAHHVAHFPTGFKKVFGVFHCVGI